MVNREKRLEKGIQSIDEQIRIHEEKIKTAEEEGNIERVDYYEKELAKFKREKEKKEELLK
jgi:hypothetical protein